MRRIALTVFMGSTLFLLLIAAARLQAQPTNQIILPYSAAVQVVIVNAMSNNCNGDLGIASPEDRLLVQNYNDKRGQTIELGPYDAGDELIFYIEPKSFCSGYRYLSTDTTHARVHTIADGIWRIEWEDLPTNWPPDNDFDDLILTVRLVGAYPEYRQNVGTWATNTYDGLSSTISTTGCALTSVANLLAYYGARDMDPGTLNDWLTDNNGYSSAGGVDWWATDDYEPPDSDVRVMEYIGRTISPTLTLTDNITLSLQNNWPVIIEYDMDSSPSGVHFVVVVGSTENDDGELEFIVKDPFTSTTQLTQVAASDTNILSGRFYQPSDQLPRPATTIWGLSPIELLIVDQYGNRLGYDPVTQSIYREIPGATYNRDLPYWNPADPTSSGDAGGGLAVEMLDFSHQDYDLYVYGTGSGSFTVEANYTNGWANYSAFSNEGDVSPGDLLEYRFDARFGIPSLSLTRAITTSVQPERLTMDEWGKLWVRFTDASGAPISNAQLTFTSTLTLDANNALTDANGMAAVSFYSGSRPGTAAIELAVDGLATSVPINIEGGLLYLPTLTRH